MHRDLIHKADGPKFYHRWLLLVLWACLYATTASAAWNTTANTTVVANGSAGRYWTAADTEVAARANAIVLDSAGNIYSTGFRDTGGVVPADMLVAKHDSAGNLLWEAVYDGGNYDEGTAITLDGAGSLYVTGRSFNGTDEDIIIIKYLVDGTQSWTRVYDSTTGDDVPVAVVADAANVYVTGRSNNGANQDIVTIRYDNLGAGLQVAVFNDAQNANDQPVGIGLDSLGNVYVGGTSVAAALDNDYVLLKYATADLGSLLWTRTYDSGQRDDATAMAMDPINDKVYLTGWSFADGVRNFATVAFAADGSTPWGSGSAVARVSPFLSGNHIPAAITTDSGGNIYVTGRSGTAFAFDFYTVKYDAAGNLAWAANPVYDSGGNDEPVAIAVDTAGNVYVLGESGAALGSRNLSTVFYDNTGTQTTVLSYDAGGDETAGGIALGADNEGLSTVHIAGGSDRVLATGLPEGDFTLVKYGDMRPDLLVNSLTGPVQGASDGVITLNDAIGNLLDSSSGRLSDTSSFTVAYYLASTSNPATATLFPLLDAFNSAANATRTLTGLASGLSSAVQLQVLVPSVTAVPEGNYWLAAKADVNNVIPERDEINNLLIGGAISIVNPPDLSPTAVTTVASAPAASTIPVDYTIANLRPVAAAAFPVTFVLSTDSVIGNADDIALIGSDTVGGIAGNSSFSRTGFMVTIPNNTSPGTYFIGVIADPGNTILESDITNNSLLSTTSLTVQVIPDLTVTAVSGDPGAMVGGSTVVNNTVQSANAASSNIQVDLYLSTDPVITTGDILLGSRVITGTVAANTTDSAATTVTIPAGTAQGIYYLGAIVDGANSIPESNDNNNSLAAASTISIGLPAGQAGALPDLIVSSVTGPASATRGDTNVPVNTTVQNVLPEGIISSFDVGIYMSLDPLITTADIFLGSRTINGLAGNTSDTAPTNVNIPQQIIVPVSWTNIVNATVTGSLLTKTGGADLFDDAGAASVQTISADGSVDFTIPLSPKGLTVGLSNSDPDTLQNSIQFGILMRIDGALRINEQATEICPGSCNVPYNAGDTFTIKRTGSTITYYQNGALIYTSLLSSSGSLLVDVTLRSSGSQVDNVSVTNTVTPGNYFLGAIADINNTVAEVDENNNAAVQTDVNGNPSGSTISVVQGGSSGGGGLLAWGELLALLAWLLGRMQAAGQKRLRIERLQGMRSE